VNVFLYPEYYNGKLCGKDIEVFARRIGRRMRMSLRMEGAEKCSYEKITPEGGLDGGSGDQSPAVFLYGTVAMGLVCCCDIQEQPSFLCRLHKELAESKPRHKVILVSARMKRRTGWNFEHSIKHLASKNVTLVLCDGGDYGSFIAAEGERGPAQIGGMTFHICDGK